MIYRVLGWRWGSLYFIIRTIIQHKDKEWGFIIFLIVIFIPFLPLGGGRLQSVLRAVRQAVRETPTVRQPHQLLRPPPQAGKPHTPQWGGQHRLNEESRGPLYPFIGTSNPPWPSLRVGVLLFPRSVLSVLAGSCYTNYLDKDRTQHATAHFHWLILWHGKQPVSNPESCFFKQYFLHFDSVGKVLGKEWGGGLDGTSDKQSEMEKSMKWCEHWARWWHSGKEKMLLLCKCVIHVLLLNPS